MITDTLTSLIEKSLDTMGVPKDMVSIQLDHPGDQNFGDYSTNIAMTLFKSLGASSKSPFELAEKIAKVIQEQAGTLQPHVVKKVEAVHPGFINFHLTNSFFADSVKEILEKTAWFGKNTKYWNKKVIIEHTNLNPFKPFHIGHLVNNAIGESLSRIFEFQDMKLSRASYGGDVGLHVAKTLWGVMKLQKEFPQNENIHEQIDFLGKAYVFGSTSYDEGGAHAEEIKVLNKQIYDKSDTHVVSLYEWGREVSLRYFRELYKRLGTRFDYSFFESEVAEEGKSIVHSGLSRGIFTESEGAIIFKGEDYGLHNRVFITSQGLPTYEAKELGLTKKKFELHDFDYSIIVTASEQNDYFRVVLKALEQLFGYSLEGWELWHDGEDRQMRVYNMEVDAANRTIMFQ